MNQRFPRFRPQRQSDQEQPPMPGVSEVNALDIEINAYAVGDGPAATAFGPHELFLCLAAGYEPIQVVFGNIVYSMGIGGIVRSFRRGLKRGEVPDFTRLLNDARVLARNRMLAQAHELGADMVLHVELTVQTFADFIEVTATGTAVKKTGAPNFAALPVAVGA